MDGLKFSDTFLVGFINDVDAGTLVIVGHKEDGDRIQIINALQGKDAIDAYDALMKGRKEK